MIAAHGCRRCGSGGPIGLVPGRGRRRIPHHGGFRGAYDAPDDYIEEASDWDCNDDDADVNPGQEEQCDEVDNDCDLVVDEEDAVGCTDSYIDEDGDGFGAAEPACICELDETFSTEEGVIV